MGDPKEHLLQTFANAVMNYYDETGNKVLELDVDWEWYHSRGDKLTHDDLKVKVEL